MNNFLNSISIFFNIIYMHTSSKSRFDQTGVDTYTPSLFCTHILSSHFVSFSLILSGVTEQYCRMGTQGGLTVILKGVLIRLGSHAD